jgi:hypothetical protein
MFAPPIKRTAGGGAAGNARPRLPAPVPVPAATRAARPGFAALPVRAPAGLFLKTGAAAAPDARLEREADRAAERVAAAPAGARPERPHEHRASPSAPRNVAPPPVREAIQGGGQPLPEPALAAMEAGFGRSFADVRIHRGAHADAAAKAMGALAFTYGGDIGFRSGQFAPDSGAGRTLLAHELSHVVQQEGGAAVQLKEDPKAAKATAEEKQKKQQATYERARDKVATRLFGTDALYARYRAYDITIGLTPVLKGKEIEYENRSDFGAKLEKDLIAAGFPGGIEEYGKLVDFVESSFAWDTARLAEAQIAQYARLLRTEKTKYEKTNAASQLSKAVSATGAAAQYDEADQAAALAVLAGSTPVLAQATAAKYGKAQARAEKTMLGATKDHPLVQEPGFDREELAEEPEDAKTQMLGYIEDRLEGIAEIRKKLSADPLIIYDLPELFEASLKAQGIPPGSVYDKIVRDFRKDREDAAMLTDIALGVIAIVAGLLTFGVGTAAAIAVAGVGFGAGVISTIRTYNTYALEKNAYLSGLISKEPSFAWVVLAAVGSVVDAAAFAKAFSAPGGKLRRIIEAFNSGADANNVEKLADQLNSVKDIEGPLKQKIVNAAASELEMRAAWKKVLTPTGGGKTMAVAHAGLAAAAWGTVALGKLSFAIYASLRHGIRTIDKFLASEEAVALLGKITKLDIDRYPKEFTALKLNYLKALEDVESIAAYGKKLGIVDDDLIPFMHARGLGTSVKEIEASMEITAAARKTATVQGGASVKFVPAKKLAQTEGWTSPLAKVAGEMTELGRYKTVSELQAASLRQYQSFVDAGYAKAVELADAGKLKGLNREQAIGSYMDEYARTRMRLWYADENILEGPGQLVRVNRRLYGPTGAGYRVPDMVVGNKIFDASLTMKDLGTPQIADFVSFAPGADVIVIRPHGLGSYSMK